MCFSFGDDVDVLIVSSIVVVVVVFVVVVVVVVVVCMWRGVVGGVLLSLFTSHFSWVSF